MNKNTFKKRLWLISILGISLMSANEAFACTTVVAGKNITSDGSIIIARNEDNQPAWGKKFIVNPPKEKAFHYISKGNGYSIDLPAHGQKYTSTPDWTDKSGTFGESGTNASNVSMSATESSNTNSDVLKVDPYVEKGISEDSMLDVVLPYINTAREGVLRLGKIIENQGTNESDGVIFADNKEAWYFESGGGHEWAAQRIPDNKYAVIPNEIVLGNINIKDSSNFLASSNLMNFAHKNKFISKKNNEVCFYKVFGTAGKTNQTYDGARQWDGQRLLSPSHKQKIGKSRYTLWMKPDHKIDVKSVEQVLSSHFNGTKYDTYGKWEGTRRPIGVPYTVESHIFQVRPWIKNNLGTIEWLAMASPETSAFIPFYVDAINNTPNDYHVANQNYDENSAYWIYANTRTLTKNHHNKLVNNEIIPAQNKLYKTFNQNIIKIDKDIDKHSDDSNYVTKVYEKSNADNSKLAEETFKKINNRLVSISDKDNNIMAKLKHQEDNNYAD